MIAREYTDKQKAAVNKLKDPKHFLENYTKIKGKKAGHLIPFKLNEAQKDLFNTLKKWARVIILKARQLGFSTGVVGYFYHRTIYTPSTNTALIGYNSEMTSELLDKIKTLWRTTPEKLRPTLRYNSKYEISFPTLESKVVVLPASKTVGRGYTLHNCLATEAAFWDDAEEKLAILEASVPENGKLVIETTPSTVGTAFHRKWSVPNDYAKKEYGWWWGYSREEIDKVRRNMADDLRFFREYELEFDSTGMNVFPREIIRAQRKFILRMGDKVEMTNGEFWTVKPMMHGLRVYRPPQTGTPYVIGADIAEGVEGGDYSVAVVIDKLTGEEVAFWRGHVAPDKFGEMLNEWGRYYNCALVAPEVNNHGLTTVTILKQKFYPNMYVRPKKFDVPGLDMSQYLGWKTTQSTRPMMIDDFHTAIRNQEMIVRSKEILDEMMVFVFNKNMKPVAEEGWHDDTIFAAGIAVQGLKMVYVGDTSQIDYSQHIPQSSTY